MTPVDEPALGPDGRDGAPAADPLLRDRIDHLVRGEAFAVLCTQGAEQPYGSVIAFVVGDDLCQAAFCTARATRKYRLLSECRRVALVIDNRSKHGEDTRRVSAVTATGSATELEPGSLHEHWHRRLLKRHPYLREFLASPSCALFRVDIVRFLHVVRFQEVSQWLPPTSR